LIAKTLLMKIFAFLSLWMMFVLPLNAQDMTKEILYVGTYSQGGSKGVYVVEMDRAARSHKVVQTVHDKQNPTFLAVHPSQQFLYVAYREGEDQDDKNGTIFAYSIDPATGELSKLNFQSSMGESPCHVSVDPTGSMLYVSNYRGGNLAAYKINDDGSLASHPAVVQHQGSSVHPQRQDKPYMHSMIPSQDGRYVYASDLGIDRIMVYSVDAEQGILKPAPSPFVSSEQGAGPRHLVVHPRIPYAYSVEELSNMVAIYHINEETGALTAKGKITMLSDAVESEDNSAADIHLSSEGTYLYASNRGQDNLVIYKIDPLKGQLSLLGHHPTGGKHPRNFKIDAQNELIYVANMHSDNIVVFERDASTGLLQSSGWELDIPQPACVEQVFLSKGSIH